MTLLLTEIIEFYWWIYLANYWQEWRMRR